MLRNFSEYAYAEHPNDSWIEESGLLELPVPVHLSFSSRNFANFEPKEYHHPVLELRVVHHYKESNRQAPYECRASLA
jgi:hypothetical protein